MNWQMRSQFIIHLYSLFDQNLSHVQIYIKFVKPVCPPRTIYRRNLWFFCFFRKVLIVRVVIFSDINLIFLFGKVNHRIENNRFLVCYMGFCFSSKAFCFWKSFTWVLGYIIFCSGDLGILDGVWYSQSKPTDFLNQFTTVLWTWIPYLRQALVVDRTGFRGSLLFITISFLYRYFRMEQIQNKRPLD